MRSWNRAADWLRPALTESGAAKIVTVRYSVFRNGGFMGNNAQRCVWWSDSNETDTLVGLEIKRSNVKVVEPKCESGLILKSLPHFTHRIHTSISNVHFCDF